MKNHSSSFLNKSEATYLLHSFYLAVIKKKGLPNNHPDFCSLINENIRNPNSPSATIAGYPRGNKAKFGHIEHIRIRGRAMFSKSHLREWFIKCYYPMMIEEAA